MEEVKICPWISKAQIETIVWIEAQRLRDSAPDLLKALQAAQYQLERIADGCRCPGDVAQDALYGIWPNYPREGWRGKASAARLTGGISS